MDRNYPRPFNVIVTKTGRGGDTLTRLFKERAVESYLIPTLEIKGEDVLVPMEDFQQAIFLSRNAVEFSLGKNVTIRELLPEIVIAVGPGTRESLYQQGINQVLIPQQHNSEGILCLDELKDIRGQHILLIKGEGGRGLIEEVLSDAGAFCHVVDVYKRVTVEIDKKILTEALTGVEVSLISLASVDALLAFYANTHKLSTSVLHLFVASQRIASEAEKLGYTHIYNVNSAANDKMFETIMNFIEQAKG